MKIVLISHTQLSDEYKAILSDAEQTRLLMKCTDGQALALTAIRTCYSANKPSEILALEGNKYLGEDRDINRLINHIVKSGHTSTLEGITFNFAVEGVSRALLAQLTRHRVGFSYSVQSQRYVRMGSDDKIGGFDYTQPDSIYNKSEEAIELYEEAMETIQGYYDELRSIGIPAEDARSVLPNAACTNLVLTVNLRALLDFYAKRQAGKGAQHEITVLAEELKNKVVAVEPWTESFFGGAN